MSKQNITVAADAVVFRKLGNKLQLLLIKRGNDPFKGMWALPGGFVEDDEELETAAIRELEEETGLKLSSLKQLHAFGKVGRDPRGRCISITHYAIVDSDHEVAGGDDAAHAEWVNLEEITELAFDHMEVLEFAVRELAPQLK